MGALSLKSLVLILTSALESIRSHLFICMKGPLMLRSVANCDNTYGWQCCTTRSPFLFVMYIAILTGHCPKHWIEPALLAVATRLSVVGKRSFTIKPNLVISLVEMQVCQLFPESNRALIFIPSILTGRNLVNLSAACASRC